MTEPAPFGRPPDYGAFPGAPPGMGEARSPTLGLTSVD
jgi:hypothetical protein